MNTSGTSLSQTLDGPLDLPASFAPLGRAGDDGLDRWDGRVAVRTLRLDGRAVPYVARPAGTLSRPRLEVELPPGEDAAGCGPVIRATIGTEAGAVRALHALGSGDPAVGVLAKRYPGLRPVLFREPFGALVRSISAQQVNLPWAAQIRRRLAESYGRRHEIAGDWVYSLDPAELARASVEDLRALQLTGAKSRSLIACARAAVEGGLELDDLATLGDEDVIARLTRLPGIGRWSAEWFIARTLGRPTVVAGDLGVRKAVGRMYAAGTLVDEARVRELTAHWGVAASLVQVLALQQLADDEAAGRRRPSRGLSGRATPRPPPAG